VPLGMCVERESSCALWGGRCARKVIWGVVLAGLLILTSSITSSLHAQKAEKNDKAEKTERKPVHKEVTVYPAVLKSNYIGGIVRLKVGISPRGTVGSATTADVKFIFNPFVDSRRLRLRFSAVACRGAHFF
jgi:hypothetical protein